jgi:hypothetical protein
MKYIGAAFLGLWLTFVPMIIGDDLEPIDAETEMIVDDPCPF